MGQQLGRWWNGRWGRLGRKDIWAESRDDGTIEVRWRGGDWTDRDAHQILGDPTEAVALVRHLIESSGTPVQKWVDWFDRPTKPDPNG